VLYPPRQHAGPRFGEATESESDVPSSVGGKISGRATLFFTNLKIAEGFDGRVDFRRRHCPFLWAHLGRPEPFGAPTPGSPTVTMRYSPTLVALSTRLPWPRLSPFTACASLVPAKARAATA
jgi:hypothetical protein